MDNMEEQIRVVAGEYARQQGFPADSVIVTTRNSATADEVEIRLSCGNTYTVVALSGHTLRLSAAMQAPMIIEYIRDGIVRLRNEIIRSYCTLHNIQGEVNHLVGRIREQMGVQSNNYMGVDRTADPNRLDGLNAWIPQVNPFVEPDNKIDEMLKDMRTWIVSLEDKDLLDEWDGRVEELKEEHSVD